MSGEVFAALTPKHAERGSRPDHGGSRSGAALLVLLPQLFVPYRWRVDMILKFVTKNGSRVHGPPYSKAEEADFYRRNADGPVTVARRADDRKGQKSQAPRRFA